MASRVNQPPAEGEASKQPHGRGGIVGLINAMFFGIVGVYTATSSVWVTIIAGVVVGALAGIYVVIHPHLLG